MRAEESRAVRAKSISETRELIARGQFEDAFQRCARELKLNPADPEFHYIAGTSAWRAFRPAESGQHLAEAARLAPQHPAAHQALADWCLNTGNVPGALTHSAKAMSIAPAEPEVLATRASALAVSGNSVEAWAIVLRMCQTGYVPLRALALRGRLAPLFDDAPASLRMMLDSLSSVGESAPDRASVHFAAARLLEDAGEYDGAMAQARMGHAAQVRPYDPNSISRQVDSDVAYYTPARLHDLPRASHGSRRPVFIVGMPRSGTSLVEQILASHPQVYGAGELDMVPRLARAAAQCDPTRGCQYPQCLDALSLLACDQLARRYLDELARLNTSARYVTDKMPLNFLHMGLITLLFPDCHVIHCARDPMDTCVSCYMTDFAMGNEFAQDLGHLGAFHVQYRRLIGHWQETLNVPLIEVRYEELVSDIEGVTKDLLECLDLPWDGRCLEFHRTRRHVGSASSHQVRRPIYNGSIGRWRRYEKHVGPLREGLDEVEPRSAGRDLVGAV
jgi:hypothetical protein